MRDPELNRLLEGFDGTKVVIRPSAVDQFTSCPRQWALTHIAGLNSIPSGRAAIGTAIHAAAEQGWRESMALHQKSFGALDSLKDLAADSLIEQDLQSELRWDDGENIETGIKEARAGVETFVEDIVPFADIPIAVEERYTVELDHPVVQSVSGTVDYISKDTIADIKTSKRKPVVQSYETQQSIYKLLAESNGHSVQHNMIHGVVLKAKLEAHILALQPNVEKAKFALNTILDVTEAFQEQKVAPELLFRGNPKYYLCDAKYCAFYSTCPYVQGAKK